MTRIAILADLSHYNGAPVTNGNDEYRFGFGDGEDVIVNNDISAGNADTIALGAGDDVVYPDSKDEPHSTAIGELRVSSIADGNLIALRRQ